jgi:hypothetical protein
VGKKSAAICVILVAVGEDWRDSRFNWCGGFFSLQPAFSHHEDHEEHEEKI